MFWGLVWSKWSISSNATFLCINTAKRIAACSTSRDLVFWKSSIRTGFVLQIWNFPLGILEGKLTGRFFKNGRKIVIFAFGQKSDKVNYFYLFFQILKFEKGRASLKWTFSDDPRKVTFGVVLGQISKI